MPEMVMGFVVDREGGQVLLSRKVKPDAWHGRFNGISGACQPGEEPAAAMERKLREETGLVVPAEAWQEVLVLETQQGPLHVFRAWALPYAAQSKGEETLVRLQVASHWRREPLVPNLRWILPLVLEFGGPEPVRAKE